jgi:transcriptional regulator with XRE-family HTH domain
MPAPEETVTVAEIVAGNIRRIRTRKRITQEGLAGLSGLNKAHMYRIENGIAGSPQLDTLEKIAAALEVHIVTLLRGCP